MFLDKPIILGENEINDILQRLDTDTSDDAEVLLTKSVLRDALNRGNIFKEAGVNPVYLYYGKYKIDVVSDLLMEGKLH